MPLYLTPTFLDDLKESDDARFVRRVLNHVCGGEGDFLVGRDDHRFHGIDGAWIRYVSAGRTAYRIIYIRNGADVYFYRAGPHSVEDNLVSPRALTGIPIGASPAGPSKPTALNYLGSFGDIVKTSDAVMLSTLVRSMVHLAHKEIVLVSPYYSTSMLESKAPFGRFIDKAIEEDTVISFITKGTDAADLDFFGSLEARGVCVYFHPRLHAKMYLFDIDQEQLNIYTKDARPTAIIGSANLTDMGLALAGDGSGNEELCYRLPVEQFEEARTHAYWLIRQSADFVKFRSRTSRRTA